MFFFFFGNFSVATRMFPKFQKACDKLGRFVQNRANLTAFRSHTSMAIKAPKVQALYELCQKIFTPSGAPPPSSQAINKLCSVMDTMSPADVGLKEENLDDDRGHGFFGVDQLNRIARWAQPITYLDIYECDSFTMCIFCFPTSSVIPLHDHPGMTVFSKVLYGSLHVRAYDWVEPAQETNGPNFLPVRLAKLAVDKVLTAPCGTSILYPRSGGNLHNFTAVTPCAVLDILTPPYREDAGRRCTYYRDYPYTAFATVNGTQIEDGKEDEYAWLAEIEPDNLYMRSGNYTGPTIQNSIVVDERSLNREVLRRSSLQQTCLMKDPPRFLLLSPTNELKEKRIFWLDDNIKFIKSGHPYESPSFLLLWPSSLPNSEKLWKLQNL